MKAPDRITLSKYNITKDGDVVFAWLTNSPDCEPMIHPVEYVRADTFIEKAQDFFRQSHHLFGLDGNELYHFIEDFRKYMKGE